MKPYQSRVLGTNVEYLISEGVSRVENYDKGTLNSNLYLKPPCCGKFGIVDGTEVYPVSFTVNWIKRYSIMLKPEQK